MSHFNPSHLIVKKYKLSVIIVEMSPFLLQGLYTWSSMSGRKVVLTATNLTSLSEVERLCLQKIALAKLQRMDLGCPVTTPKGESSLAPQPSTLG